MCARMCKLCCDRGVGLGFRVEGESYRGVKNHTITIPIETVAIIITAKIAMTTTLTTIVIRIVIVIDSHGTVQCRTRNVIVIIV